MKNNLHRRATIFFLTAFAVALCSCAKKSNPVYINSDLKKYFDYKAGSYWVFYDSLNKYYDSLSVLAYQDDQGTINDVPTEQCSIGIYGYYLDSIGSDGTQWSFLLENSSSDLIINDGIYIFTSYFPFPIGLQSFPNSAPYPISSNTSLIDSFSVNGNIYMDVYVCRSRTPI
jgi:hypothetical protein